IVGPSLTCGRPPVFGTWPSRLERFVQANTRVVVDYDFQAHMGRERSLGGVQRALRELAANIMRVVDGNGRPDMIGPQAQALVYAMDAHRSISGRTPSGD